MISTPERQSPNGSSTLVLTPVTPGRSPRLEFAGEPAPAGPGYLRRRSESIKVLNTYQGSSFPRLLSPRRRTDHALLSVVQEAYLLGTGPGLVGLGHALGIPAVSSEDVEQLCRDLDVQARAFRTRRLDDQYPYLMVETVSQKYREGGRLHSAMVVIAAAVRADGEREVVAVDLAPARDPGYWVEFFTGLRGRGLQDVRLVTSAAYPGIKDAVIDLFPGATWQLCREHFTDSAMSLIPESDSRAIRRELRQLFAHSDGSSAVSAVRRLRDQLSAGFPKLGALIEQHEADLLCFYRFPRQHRERIWSTAILDRLLKDVSRQSRVVGIFPTRQALMRLIGAVVQDRNEEWAAGFRYFSPASMQRMASAA
ncbi:MAG: IS256 family transposase [Chloroflexi bacterium]|nr:MAG: IS256 family transposase [Chloroflexota bacterium]